jgi:hypothetical protein
LQQECQSGVYPGCGKMRGKDILCRHAIGAKSFSGFSVDWMNDVK